MFYLALIFIILSVALNGFRGTSAALIKTAAAVLTIAWLFVQLPLLIALAVAALLAVGLTRFLFY